MKFNILSSNKETLHTDNSIKRSILLKRNIIISFILKAWSGIMQLLLVALTLRCLGVYNNGIWLILSSILVWIDMLDIGLGNGLRNRLAADLAHNDKITARKDVSTTLSMLIIIIIPIIFVSYITIYSLDLYSILNIDKTRVPNLNKISVIAITLVCATFILKITNNVYMALQLPAISNAITTIGNTLGVVLTFILYLNNSKSLLEVVFVNTVSPLIIYIINYYITFYIKYKWMKPSIYFFEKSILKHLLSLGTKFFILQIAAIVLFTSSNILISKILSPSEVTPYQVCYKYFSILYMPFTVIVTPYWSATTDAFERGDITWIIQSVNKIKKVLLILLLFSIVMILIANYVYKLWIGNNVHISLEMNILMALYIMLLLVSSSYSTILNGMGILKLQLIFTSISAIIYIPIAIYMGNILGLYGIITALIIVNLPGTIINIWKYNKIISNYK